VTGVEDRGCQMPMSPSAEAEEFWAGRVHSASRAHALALAFTQEYGERSPADVLSPVGISHYLKFGTDDPSHAGPLAWGGPHG
jgi:hypothetical protein